MPYTIEPQLHCALYKLDVGDRLRTIQTLAVADSIRQLLQDIEGHYNNGTQTSPLLYSLHLSIQRVSTDGLLHTTPSAYTISTSSNAHRIAGGF